MMKSVNMTIYRKSYHPCSDVINNFPNKYYDIFPRALGVTVRVMIHIDIVAYFDTKKKLT